jgi:ATP-dependent Clp protease ATP-binding subunit ClpB
LESLRSAFRPEFLNRVDDVVLFKPLRREEIREIVRLLLKGLSDRLSGRQIALSFDEEAVDFIADAGYDPVYGARPLKRVIVRSVETPLARSLIAGGVTEGAAVRVKVENDELAFDIGGPGA